MSATLASAERPLSWGRVKREAPGAYPFEEWTDAFGTRLVAVDPCGDPDEFELAVAMARQGYVPRFGGSSKTNGDGHYVFEYDPDAIAWLGGDG